MDLTNNNGTIDVSFPNDLNEEQIGLIFQISSAHDREMWGTGAYNLMVDKWTC